MPKAKNLPEIGSEEFDQMLAERSAFLLAQTRPPEKAYALTHWEEIDCLGYNPQMRRLETVVRLKQCSGYGGDLGSAASPEFVRFYLDFHDGLGFVDVGLTSFKSADIPVWFGGPEHPLCYLVFLEIDDLKHRRFIDCHTAVLPKARAVLSWKVFPPPHSPDFIPPYGNVREADIQLERKTFVRAREVFEFEGAQGLLGAINPDVELALKEPTDPTAAAIHASNKKAGVPDRRTFYPTIGAAVQSHLDFHQATSLFKLDDLPALKVDPLPMLSSYTPASQSADVSFEEVIAVGFNPHTDTLGAVIQIKQRAGYNGDLCQIGSREHVAFWADWNNDDIPDQYLGTASFEVHDIANIPAGGLFYNVALPIDVSGRLLLCDWANLVRVRAVLSWEALPSTINANRLNTWGNKLDALVQLRPGPTAGIQGTVTLVGNVDRLMIDPNHHLYNYNAVAPTPAHNRPWGGSISFHGIIDRNGFNGAIKFRFCYKPVNAPDSDYDPVSWSESFRLWQPDAGSAPHLDNQNADSGGWYLYDPNPALGIYDSANNYLAHLQASALADGTYTIRFEYTNEVGNPVIGDTFSIVVCNQGMAFSTAPNQTVDRSKDLDLTIDGGARHSYNSYEPSITGHLRVEHPYFASWALTIQAAAHAHGAMTRPNSRAYTSLDDRGDRDITWSLDSTPLDACGYSLNLDAFSRVILNSNPGYFPHYGPKTAGFAKLP